MVLQFIPMLLSAGNLTRSLTPGKHQYLTLYPRFKLHSGLKTRNLEIEYYTVDVDGKWSWKLYKGTLSPASAFVSLRDAHGNRIHASRAICRSWLSSRDERPDEGQEMVFLNEPYMAAERGYEDIEITEHMRDV